MTRPGDLKPREDESPGTPPEAYTVGETLPDMWFTLTPGIVAEYIAAVDGNPEAYAVDGRRAAPPNVLAVYLLAIVYRRYPPIQGIILTDVAWRFHHPIWADEDTEIRGFGEVTDKYQRRGKNFIRWRGRFETRQGLLLAEAVNTMYVPARRHERR